MKYQLLGADEVQLFKTRLAIILGVLAVLLAVLVVRLWYLQVLNGTYYEGVAQGNRIRVIPQEAPRGVIYDRNGELLVFNRPAFNIQLVLEDTPDLERTLRNLGTLSEVPYDALRAVVEERKSSLRFKPLLLMEDVNRNLADRVEAYLADLPGLGVAVESKRLYPHGPLASHVLGYVGSISERQLRRLPLDRLYSGTIVGQSGVEKVVNNALIGYDGGRQVEVDHVGRELRVLNEPVNPLPGNDVYLTLDARLQGFVEDQLVDKTGAIVVSDPRTGEILAMASAPDFNPNLFVGRDRDAVWERMTNSEGKPLLNKAVNGTYPPGSTFKMVLAAAGLEEGLVDREATKHCPGYHRVGRDIFYCSNRAGHGEVNVVEAIEYSCNVFFYKLGLELGVDKIAEYAHRFGFGEQTGIALEGEQPGLIPTKAWKERALKKPWYIGETAPVAIGQGYVSVTPLQMVEYMNVIANGGTWVRPTVLRQILTFDGREVLAPPLGPRESRRVGFHPDTLATIREAMTHVVNRRGTARSARSRDFQIAGKTGTAQVVGRATALTEEQEQALQPHSLFVGFAPAQNPKVTISVVVEHGRSGGRVAAPIAKDVLEFYNKHVESLDVPHLPEGPDRVAALPAPQR